jgi:hypothetical protein
LAPADARHTLATAWLNLTQKGIALRLINHNLLSDLSKIVAYGVALRAERFPQRMVLPIERFEQQTGEYEGPFRKRCV